MAIRTDQVNIDSSGALLVRDVAGAVSSNPEAFDANGNLKVIDGNGAYDPDGSQKVSTTAGQFPLIVGDLVALNSAVFADVSDCSNISFTIKNTGTAAMTAGTFAFEGSINSTTGTDGDWFTVTPVRTNSNTVETGNAPALTANTIYSGAWKLSTNGFNWFRIRTTVATATNSIGHWTLLRGAYPSEPVPAIQTHAVTGSGNFTIAAASGTNYGLISAATTNAALVKSTAGAIFELTVFNPSAATVYLKLYNLATAPIVGTSIPIATIPIPAGGEVTRSYGFYGKRFSTGIGIAITTNGVATDTTVVAAGIQTSMTYV